MPRTDNGCQKNKGLHHDRSIQMMKAQKFCHWFLNGRLFKILFLENQYYVALIVSLDFFS